MGYNVNVDSSYAVGTAVQSVVAINCVFDEYLTSPPLPGAEPEQHTYSGAGVIYELDKEEGDAVSITNYHVVYNSSANADNGSDIGRRLVVYLYGSEDKDKPEQINGETDELGYPVLDYGDYAIECDFVGGS